MESGVWRESKELNLDHSFRDKEVEAFKIVAPCVSVSHRRLYTDLDQNGSSRDHATQSPVCPPLAVDLLVPVGWSREPSSSRVASVLLGLRQWWSLSLCPLLRPLCLSPQLCAEKSPTSGHRQQHPKDWRGNQTAEGLRGLAQSVHLCLVCNRAFGFSPLMHCFQGHVLVFKVDLKQPERIRAISPGSIIFSHTIFVF